MSTIFERIAVLLVAVAGLMALAGAVGYSARTLDHWTNIRALTGADLPVIDRSRVLDAAWYQNPSELQGVSRSSNRDVIAIMVAADCPACDLTIQSWNDALSVMSPRERPHAMIVPLDGSEVRATSLFEVARPSDPLAFREAIGVTGIPLTWAITPSKFVRFIQAGAPDERSLARAFELLRQSAVSPHTEVLKIGAGQLLSRPQTLAPPEIGGQ